MVASTMPVGGGARADPGGRTPARRPSIGSRRGLRLGDSVRRGAHPGVVPCPRPCGGSAWGRALGVTAGAPQPRPARARGSGLTPASRCLWLGAAWRGPCELAFGS